MRKTLQSITMRTTVVHTRQSSCFLSYKQTTVIWNFHKMPFVCLLPNKQVQFITKMRVVPTGGEHKGGMMKDEQMTLSARKPFTSLKTQNWTQRIILKHLKSEDVGMLTLSSSFLNATARGCRHVPDLLLLFVIIVLILVLIVFVVKALICAVHQYALIVTKFNLGIQCSLQGHSESMSKVKWFMCINDKSMVFHLVQN